MIGQLSHPWWFFIILGIGAGLLSGTLGLGSGIVLVPVLGLLCAYGQKSAQGMALAIMVPMAMLGAWRYWKNPAIEMNLNVIVLVIAGALVGTLGGTELASRLPAHMLRKLFAIFLVIVAIRMFFGPSKSDQSGRTGTLHQEQNLPLTDQGDNTHDAR